jgi:hypothetical protein
MSKIQIKRYNGGTSTWENQFPITKAQHLVATSDGTTTIFDTNDKIKPSYLPDSVFDSLLFVNTASTATQYDPQGSNALLRDMAHFALNNVTNRTIVGAYFVAVETIPLDANTTGALSGYGAGLYWITRLTGTDEGGLGTAGSMGSATTTTLETGDWIVITNLSGAGTSGNPYIVTFAIVENTYELATTDVDGIVQLSSQTVWANLAGNNVITDARLKALVDGQNFTNTSHTHLLAAGATDVTATASELNVLDGELITTTELNYLSGVTSSIQTQLNAKANLAGPTFTGTVVLPSTTSIGTVDSTEIGYLDGVTSAIQTQINTKQATITGGATTIVSSNLTVSRALVSDGSGKVAVSAVTSTELGYVAGVTSAIQTQLTALSNRVRVFYDGTPSGMVSDDIWFDVV